MCRLDSRVSPRRGRHLGVLQPDEAGPLERSANVRHKAVYTTGDAAEICKLSQQTIIRCFDDGKIGGFRVPGSKFRRIPYDELLKFMKAHSLPTDGLENSKISVLVVDDEKEIVEIFVDALSGDGRFEVATAQSGYQAGIMTEKLQPDVVILDFKLQDINGTEVCKTIRANPDLARTRILIISGVASPAEIDELKKAGADDYIRKPFNIATVVERIMKLVRK
jgi:two-component system, OmpR family, response regulator